MPHLSLVATPTSRCNALAQQAWNIQGQSLPFYSLVVAVQGPGRRSVHSQTHIHLTWISGCSSLVVGNWSQGCSLSLWGRLLSSDPIRVPFSASVPSSFPPYKPSEVLSQTPKNQIVSKSRLGNVHLMMIIAATFLAPSRGVSSYRSVAPASAPPLRSFRQTSSSPEEAAAWRALRPYHSS